MYGVILAKVVTMGTLQKQLVNDIQQQLVIYHFSCTHL